MSKKTICFGEVLWDMFPNEKIIGGAPLNVALRMNALGVDSQIISRVGKDTLGEEIQNYLADNQLSKRFLQTSEKLPTGQVLVHLNDEGSASYTIAEPVAWDEISLTEDLKEEVSQSDLFLYGSLATRNSHSFSTLNALLSLAPYKVFDVNLRPPFYSMPVLKTLMEAADLIKFNDEELVIIQQELGGTKNDLKDQLLFLAEKTNTPTLCVTLGSEGALLYHQGEFYEQSGFPIKVVDTVGAGDSFLATLLSGILLKTSMQDTLANACAMGAMVAGRKGANPQITQEELAAFRSKNEK